MHRKGFTLVELSIVLVIIGLLIGGILVGQSLIESAKVNKTISEMAQLKIMYTQFKDKYKRPPGDLANAVSMLGCAGCNGNGNNAIEWSWGTPNECMLSMNHLAYANILTKVPKSIDQILPLEINNQVMKSPFDKAGYYICYFGSASLAALYNKHTGNYVSLQGFDQSQWTGHFGGPAVATPVAAAIDNKADDGNPGEGEIIVMKGFLTSGGTPSQGCLDTNPTYDLVGTPKTIKYTFTDSAQRCSVIYKIEN